MSPSCGQRVGQGAGRSTGVSLGFLKAPSKALLLLKQEGGGIWHCRAGKCGTVLVEMARRAHFTPPSEWLQISCTVFLIGNTFETSFHDHTYGAQKKESTKKIKERERERSKNSVQNMTQCTELTLDLTNGFFFFFNLSILIYLFFQPWTNHKFCWV